ncbi:MAG: hypothetical protein ACKO24_16795 [Leptolyngbyaceae cyanobacterium]
MNPLVVETKRSTVDLAQAKTSDSFPQTCDKAPIVGQRHPAVSGAIPTNTLPLGERSATLVVFANWRIQTKWGCTGIDGFAYNLSRRPIYIQSASIKITDLKTQVQRTEDILIQERIQPADRFLIRHWIDDLIPVDAVVRVDDLKLGEFEWLGETQRERQPMIDGFVNHLG